MERKNGLGAHLREERLAAGMSQSELERRSGIPKTLLSRYENGHVQPSIQTLRKLARALELSPARLLGSEGQPHQAFFQALEARGVRIHNEEEAVRLAEVVVRCLAQDEVGSRYRAG